MKQLKTIFVLALLAGTLASCQKKQCYVCTTVTITYKNGYYQNDQTSSATVCDMTNKQKGEYEKARYRNETAGPIRVESTTQCQ